MLGVSANLRTEIAVLKYSEVVRLGLNDPGVLS